MKICGGIRVVQGGYVVELAWPHGGEPIGYGEVICTTWSDVLNKITAAAGNTRKQREEVVDVAALLRLERDERQRVFRDRNAGATPEQKYLHDPTYHALVHTIRHLLTVANYSMEEVLAAVQLAKRIEETRVARPAGALFPVPEVPGLGNEDEGLEEV